MGRYKLITGDLDLDAVYPDDVWARLENTLTPDAFALFKVYHQYATQPQLTQPTVFGLRVSVVDGSRDRLDRAERLLVEEGLIGLSHWRRDNRIRVHNPVSLMVRVGDDQVKIRSKSGGNQAEIQMRTDPIYIKDLVSTSPTTQLLATRESGSDDEWILEETEQPLHPGYSERSEGSSATLVEKLKGSLTTSGPKPSRRREKFDKERKRRAPKGHTQEAWDYYVFWSKKIIKFVPPEDVRKARGILATIINKYGLPTTMALIITYWLKCDEDHYWEIREHGRSVQTMYNIITQMQANNPLFIAERTEYWQKAFAKTSLLLEEVTESE